MPVVDISAHADGSPPRVWGRGQPWNSLGKNLPGHPVISSGLHQNLNLSVLEFDDLLLAFIHKAAEKGQQNLPRLEKNRHVGHQRTRVLCSGTQNLATQGNNLAWRKGRKPKRFEFGGVF